jgi:hypothetical protein
VTVADSLFAFGVEINSADSAQLLVEANIIEALEARAIDCPNAMVRHEEALFPPHEYIFLGTKIRNYYIAAFPYRLGVWFEGGKFVPMRHIDLVRCAPIRVISEKSIFRADNLAFEKGRKGRVVFREAYSHNS